MYHEFFLTGTLRMPYSSVAVRAPLDRTPMSWHWCLMSVGLDDVMIAVLHFLCGAAVAMGRRRQRFYLGMNVLMELLLPMPRRRLVTLLVARIPFPLLQMICRDMALVLADGLITIALGVAMCTWLATRPLV